MIESLQSMDMDLFYQHWRPPYWHQVYSAVISGIFWIEKPKTISSVNTCIFAFLHSHFIRTYCLGWRFWCFCMRLVNVSMGSISFWRKFYAVYVRKNHFCKGFPCNSRDAMTNYCENKHKKGADVRKLSTDAEKMVNYVAILHDRTINVLERFLRYFGFVVGFDWGFIFPRSG